MRFMLRERGRVRCFLVASDACGGVLRQLEKEQKRKEEEARRKAEEAQRLMEEAERMKKVSWCVARALKGCVCLLIAGRWA